ncbi:MAG: hypothetical protein IKS85_02145 [Lachnospiraceae bacterium]|nr:hypothetical protein [Lachnospiraceae bacterium]
MELGHGAVLCLFYLGFSIGFTILIELPIIRLFKVTKRNAFIAAVNALTNTIFSMGLVFLVWRLSVAEDASFIAVIVIYILFGEFYLIPFSESELYRRISDKSKGQVLLASYVANIASFLIGLAFDFFFLSNVGRWF